MIPAITAVRLTGARNRAELPLLVLGPSLGTSATTLWSACATRLTDAFDVLAWDLPGHGHNRSVPDEPFTMDELAAGVLEVVDDLLAERGEPGGPSPTPATRSAARSGSSCCSTPRTGCERRCCCAPVPGSATPDMWADRIGQVSASGHARAGGGLGRALVRPRLPRPRARARAARCCTPCRTTDDEGYCQVCARAGGFDVRDRLAEIGAPVLAVAGAPTSRPRRTRLARDRRRGQGRAAGRARRRRAPRPGRGARAWSPV